MRIASVLFVATLVLAGCKRETEEAVAQAKGAAADAQRAAKDAAAQARSAADQASSSARSAADDAERMARDVAAQARDAAGSATDSARRGLDSAGQSVRDLAAGDQVQGVLVSTGRTVLDVRPSSGSVKTIHTDDRTRWILHGAAAGRDGFPVGSTVRVTYIVKGGEPLATQVEAVQ
jgi:multidrug efflux pump subunit AcrA (membrane-fusion protein)